MVALSCLSRHQLADVCIWWIGSHPHASFDVLCLGRAVVGEGDVDEFSDLSTPGLVGGCVIVRNK
jgi:hypothetical protein